MIKQSIPSILGDIKDKLRSCDDKLARMGTMVSTSAERRRFFLNNSHSALDLMKAVLNGTSDMFKEDGMTVISAEQDRMGIFGANILKQKLANIMKIELGSPVVVTLSDGSTERGIVQFMEIVTDKTYVYVKPLDDNNESTKLLRSREDIIVEPGVDYKINEYYLSSKRKRLFRCDAIDVKKLKGSFVNSFAIDCVQPDPTWIKLLIRSNRNLDLPCFLNYQLFKKILSDMITEQWRPLCDKLLDESVDMMKALVGNCIRNVNFARFPLLLAFVEDQIDMKLNSKFQGTKADLEKLLMMNQSPYTQNHNLFENIQKQRNQSLQTKLIKMLENNQGGSAAIVSIIKAAFDETSKMSMDDHVAAEMQIFLDSYGKVAAKRIIDEVPMLLIEQTNSIDDVIRLIVNEVSDDQLRELMVEDPHQVRQFNQVMEEKGKMEIAYKAFKDLQFF